MTTRLTTRLLLGAIAGIAGTVAMTAAMNRLRPRLPPDDPYPLPPREITERLVAIEGDDDIKDAATAAHHDYGAATGALLAATRPAMTAHYGGTAGVAVWAASYFGWVGAVKNFAEYATPGEIASEDELEPGCGAILRDGARKLALYRRPDGGRVAPVGGLHPRGLHRPLEPARNLLGLPVPRVAIQCRGRSAKRSRGDSARRGRSIAVAKSRRPEPWCGAAQARRFIS